MGYTGVISGKTFFFRLFVLLTFFSDYVSALFERLKCSLTSMAIEWNFLKKKSKNLADINSLSVSTDLIFLIKIQQNFENLHIAAVFILRFCNVPHKPLNCIKPTTSLICNNIHTQDLQFSLTQILTFSFNFDIHNTIYTQSCLDTLLVYRCEK